MTRPPNEPTRSATGARRRGFTLLELMISIALVLILILGVNTVFSLTSQTVGAGNALGTMYRANQSAHGVIYQDFKAMVVGADEPCLVIINQRRDAFRNAADREADRDGNALTYDVDGDGDEETYPNWSYNLRNHRLDRLCFFARGKFFRQTGTGNNFWDADPADASRPASSNEAFIKYGFLSLPNNAGAYKTPGDDNPQDNPNNYYASQWVLGRSVMLLMPTVPAGHEAYQANAGAGPLGVNSRARNDSSELIQRNRYDVAQTSMAAYRQNLADPNNNKTSGSGPLQYWRQMDFYFQADIFANQAPTPASVARTLPAFVPGCTHFYVEYAGDFFTQDETTGKPTPAVPRPDGITDWAWEKKADVTGTKTNSAAWVRKTRWYGYPRDVNGDGYIYGGSEGDDVVPARDFAESTTWFVWERFNPNQNEGREFPPPTPTKPNTQYVIPSGGGTRYIAAWGADDATADPAVAPRPTMLRILITVDDPASRVGNGETFEYVGNLK